MMMMIGGGGGGGIARVCRVMMMGACSDGWGVVVHQDIVVKDIDQPPDTASGVAIQHVRIQVLDRRTGRPLPQEQVYRSHAVLLAHAPDHHTSLDARDTPDGDGVRVLVALGPEAKETVRLPKGYFIASNPVRLLLPPASCIADEGLLRRARGGCSDVGCRIAGARCPVQRWACPSS